MAIRRSVGSWNVSASMAPSAKLTTTGAANVKPEGPMVYAGASTFADSGVFTGVIVMVALLRERTGGMRTSTT